MQAKFEPGNENFVVFNKSCLQQAETARVFYLQGFFDCVHNLYILIMRMVGGCNKLIRPLCCYIISVRKLNARSAIYHCDGVMLMMWQTISVITV